MSLGCDAKPTNKGDRVIDSGRGGRGGGEASEHCVQNFYGGGRGMEGERVRDGTNSWGNSVFDTPCALKAAMLLASHKRNTG